MDQVQYSGIQTAQVGVKAALEDFLKIEYTDGLRNEFSTMEALLNRLAKDTLTAKKKTRTFALGVTDNIRALGRSNDTYRIDTLDFTGAVDTVDAEFDTTKILGIFSITDETILKGTTDGSIFDVVKDSLDRMALNLKFTLNRYTYGSASGKIGEVKEAAEFTDKANANPGIQAGNKLIQHQVFTIKCNNSHNLLPGMGIMLRSQDNGAILDESENPIPFAQGKIWQKASPTVGEEEMLVVFDHTPGGVSIAEIQKGVEVFSRQITTDGSVNPEYTGLEDIVITRNNKIFGVDRSVFTSLNCTQQDLQNNLLTESELRDMIDHIAINAPDGTGINLIVSNHKIVSSIEKQMYMFKEYSLDTSANGFQLGRPDIMFDNYHLMKDKYSRDQNVYLLDTGKIGELVRKDFDWLTSGKGGMLERIDGTEIYEGIMTKYADMYIDGWRCHASFINAAETVTQGT